MAHLFFFRKLPITTNFSNSHVHYHCPWLFNHPSIARSVVPALSSLWCICRYCSDLMAISQSPRYTEQWQVYTMYQGLVGGIQSAGGGSVAERLATTRGRGVGGGEQWPGAAISPRLEGSGEEVVLRTAVGREPQASPCQGCTRGGEEGGGRSWCLPSSPRQYWGASWQGDGDPGEGQGMGQADTSWTAQSQDALYFARADGCQPGWPWTSWYQSWCRHNLWHCSTASQLPAFPKRTWIHFHSLSLSFLSQSAHCISFSLGIQELYQTGR